jgi:ATP-binding cassette subfamily F protein uup
MPDQLDMPVGKLSGGEKARILLANIMLTPCDVLLLDEPTNDLDILSLEVLEESIRQFAGAVVIVSHDRYLMDKVCHRILYLDPRSGGHFFANFDQIIQHRQTILENPEKIKKIERKKPARVIAFSFKDKFELEHIEEKILAAETEIEEISGKLKETEVISHMDKMNQFCSLLKDAQERVQALYERWEYLEAKKEGSNQ